MDRSSETIFALASGPPPSAIALVRLSGPDVPAIAEEILAKGCPGPRRAILTEVCQADGTMIDEALAIYMPAPNSFTGEHVLELNLHGGRIIVEALFQCLRTLGARMAEPGEFTRRAFEAGKLDLTRAEAIADLIDAESEAQHDQALRQFGGALADLYTGWRASLTELLALLEASVDFPDEEDAPSQVAQPAQEKLAVLTSDLQGALEAGNISERIRDGFQVAILGRPNAGKSSLLNQLAGRDAAIVTDIPGTTRDAIEVRRIIGPYLTYLTDTAGLRETDDTVEKIGVERAHRISEHADLKIWVIDQSDRESLVGLNISDSDILVLNKSDLDPDPNLNVSRETLSMSSETGHGLDALLKEIEVRLSQLAGRQAAPLLTRTRHRGAIERALEDLKRAQSALASDLGMELVAEDVRSAIQKLSSLTGEIHVEDVLGAVFSSFCIGK